MKNSYVLFLINILFIGNLFSQTKTEKEKSISILESLYYQEYYLGTKCYNKVEITFNELEGKLEFKETAFLGENANFITKNTFYLIDLDLSSLKYDLYEFSLGLYILSVRVNAKEKSIEKNLITVDISKFPYPTSKMEYLNNFTLIPSKPFSESLAIKLVENIKILIGAKSYKKMKLSNN